MWAKQGQMQIKNLGNTLFVLLGKDGCAKSDGTFGKVPKGEGRSFSIKKIMLQILDLYIGLFSDVFPESNFPNMRGAGSKAVCNFSENSSVLVA